MVYSEFVPKVGDFGRFSEWPRVDMLTSATEKHMGSSMKWRIKGGRHTQNQCSIKQTCSYSRKKNYFSKQRAIYVT